MSFFKSHYGKQGVPHQSVPDTPTPSLGLHPYGRNGNAVPPSPVPPKRLPAPPNVVSSQRSTPMRVYTFGAQEQPGFMMRHGSALDDPRLIAFDTPDAELQWGMANMQLPSIGTETPSAPTGGPTTPPASFNSNINFPDIDTRSDGNSSFTMPSGTVTDSPMADGNTTSTSTSNSTSGGGGKKRAREEDDDSDDELFVNPKPFKRTKR